MQPTIADSVQGNFDAADRGFYYSRVIEIPTPRWTAYEAKYFGVESPMTAQERAYTSPIWYNPLRNFLRQPADLADTIAPWNSR